MNPNAAVSAPPKSEDKPGTGDEPGVEPADRPDAENAASSAPENGGSAETDGKPQAADAQDARSQKDDKSGGEDSEEAELAGEAAVAVPPDDAEDEERAVMASPVGPTTSARSKGADAGSGTATPVPEPRAAADPDADADRGKSKKARKAVRGRSAGGTKSLVVWQQGRVHYADDSVLVLDLDEAASADLDVHDLVDRLTELREAQESTGRAEAVSALVEIIQEKALS